MGETEDAGQSLDFGHAPSDRTRSRVPAASILTSTPTACAKNAGFSEFSAIPTPPPSPRSACMPCSIAARRRPASSPSTATGTIPNAGSVSSAIISPRPRPSSGCPGESAIGHVRYSTTGETILRNVQPLFAELSSGGFAVAHNGNLTNGLTLRRDLVQGGAIYQSTSDTEAILHLVARSRRPQLIDRFIEALRSIEGAYSLVALTNKKLIGARDPLGIRPLVLGELDGHYILASETCALDIIGARFVRDIENGEIVVISDEGVESLRPFPPRPARPCIFEYIYFARPDSIVHGKPVYNVRKAMGAELAREAPVEADVVVPVPDSGVPAALGYRAALGHSLRTRHYPQSLCRAHLHSAVPIRPRIRRAFEA